MTPSGIVGLEVDVVALRRALHQVPELGLELPQTQALVSRALEPLGLEIHAGRRYSSLAVVIEGGLGPGPTVMLRADMDGLPLPEESGVSFASSNGNMHACGHDLHMAGLVGAVHLLAGRRNEFAGSVLAIFQPGEEGAGGAQLMIEDEVHLLTGERPLASYGVHVLSFARSGVLACRTGSVMGAAMIFEFEFVGRGGHAARPHAALDPISTAALVVQGIQTFVAQNTSPSNPIVVTVGSLTAGTAANVIPSRALMQISLRATSHDLAHEVYDKIHGIARSITEAYGLTLNASIDADLGPTISDEHGADLVRRTVAELFGSDRYSELLVPEMIAEDFSLFLEQTGGAFVLVGAATADDAAAQPTNHSPEAQFDDAVVPDVSTLLAELAIQRLREAAEGTTC